MSVRRLHITRNRNDHHDSGLDTANRPPMLRPRDRSALVNKTSNPGYAPNS